jgi:hypothetical protein
MKVKRFSVRFHAGRFDSLSTLKFQIAEECKEVRPRLRSGTTTRSSVLQSSAKDGGLDLRPRLQADAGAGKGDCKGARYDVASHPVLSHQAADPVACVGGAFQTTEVKE